ALVQVASTFIQGQSSLAWSTTTPAGMFTDPTATYRVISFALDQASNDQQNPAQAGAGSTFHYDTLVPTAAITAPTFALPVNAAALGQILGTANDPGGVGITNVQVLLKIRDLQAYWTGATTGLFASDWDSTPPGRYNHWQTVTGIGPWSQAFPPMAAVDSYQFEIWVRASNNAGLQSATPTTGQLDSNLNADNTGAYHFIYDNTPPVSNVTYPPAFTGFVAPTITGTAQDTFPSQNPAGVQDITLKMKRSTGEFWKLIGSTWTTTDPGFLNASLSGLNPWSFSALTGAFTDGYQYKVNSRAIDAANNAENAYSTYTFIVDLSTPVSGVTLPANGA